MKRNSLAFRLIVAACICILLILPPAGVLLVSFHRSMFQGMADETLRNHLNDLIASPSPTGGGLVLEKDPSLGQPLFKRPAKGWYYQIAPRKAPDEPVLKSPSLASEALSMPDPRAARTESTGQYVWGNMTGPFGNHLRVIAQDVDIGGDDREQGYTFMVTLDAASQIDDPVWSYTVTMTTAFSALGAALLIATLIQVRYGLRPLDDIRAGLAAIRSGEAEQLEGELPREIQPLQAELNELILDNQKIVKNARTHVGNLAHALKTPLSVITNEARSRDDSFSDFVGTQAEIMRQQVEHHLNKTRAQTQSGVIRRPVAVRPVIVTTRNALAKIYSNRQLDLSAECDDELRFLGEKQDLQEMIGNLMDNACKWAASSVAVSAAADGEALPQLHICVDDDGPGLSPEARAEAVKRGLRLDETKPGSGLGLSIVADLCSQYAGELRLDESPLGGVRAVLILPATQGA